MKRARSPGLDLENQWDYKREMEELSSTLPDVKLKKEIQLSPTWREVKLKIETKVSPTLLNVKLKKEMELSPTWPEVKLKKETNELSATLPEVKFKKEMEELSPTLPNVKFKKEMNELSPTLPNVKFKKEMNVLSPILAEVKFKNEIEELSTTFPEVKFKKEVSPTLPEVNFQKEIEDLNATLPEVKFKKEMELSPTFPEVKLIKELNLTFPEVKFKKEMYELSPTFPEVKFKTEMNELSPTLPEVKLNNEMDELSATLPEVKFKPDQPSQSQPDKDYQPKPKVYSIPLAMSEKRLKILCEIKLRELQVNSIEEIERIQKSTIGQHGKSRYDELRRDRLTASQFGMVCKRRASTPPQNHVHKILYPSCFTNYDMMYGQEYEATAIKLFERHTGKMVVPSGLFIDREYGFLGASPDGLVIGEDSIVEVKCFPSLARDGISVAAAARDKKGFPLYVDFNGELELHRKHNFYYQIQGQLRVCRRTRCYLIAFTSVDAPMKIIVIDKDYEFIEVMIEKLVNFYLSYVLPELVLRWYD